MKSNQETQSKEIRYGIAKSPFGWCVIGEDTHHEIRSFAFLESKSATEAQKAILKSYPGTVLVRDDAKMVPIITKIFAGKKIELPLLVTGTAFQTKVWEALMEIPEGTTSTYAEIARYIGEPKAVRAVGTACGKNPIGYLIPCHRILTSAGKLGGYAWGTARKQKILDWEASQI
jgi:AraC family transcriptional regulator of adaptative response/methylated-DNA-[protein]-cysteine methyltransferase